MIFNWTGLTQLTQREIYVSPDTLNLDQYCDRLEPTFRRLELPFRPYDLRHCWAVRTLEFGLGTALAAQQMGHSLAVHHDIYHAWITERQQQKMFDSLMQRTDRPLPPGAKA